MFTEEKKRLCQKVDALEAEMTRLSLALHARPELGNEEYEAAQLLTDASRMQGFHVTQGAAGLPTAFLAKRGDSGPKIAFLAEYDALPGLGHACGHNLIASMSFGAAAAFAALTADQAQTYFIGCPAEETQGGKIALTNAGVFNGFDAIFIVHPSDETTLGGTSLASHPLCVRFHGREAHVASRSERGINALDALVLFYQGLQGLRLRFGEQALIAGIITAGGTAPNIVPALAEMKCTVRSLSSDYLEQQVLPAVRALATGIAEGTGATVTLEHYEPLFKELIQNTDLAAYFAENLRLLGEPVRQLPDNDAGGSTDVGNVSHVAPTLHPELSIGDGLTAHTPAFAQAAGSTAAQKRALVGAKAMAMSAWDICLQNTKRSLL